MPKSQMIAWLATVCKTTREYADVKLSDIANSAGKDPSAIYRFEQGDSVPRDIETVVSAYAKCIGVPSQALWADALAAWGKVSGLDGLRERAEAKDSLNETHLEVLIERIVTEAIRRSMPKTLTLQVLQSGPDHSTSSNP